MGAATPSWPRRGVHLFRTLSRISEISGRETINAILLAADVFMLLASYYVMKTVREALILSEAGAAVKSYSAAGQALLLLAVIPAYGFVTSRVNRSRLIAWVHSFFVANLAIFYLLGTAGLHIGIAFYLWVGIFTFW